MNQIIRVILQPLVGVVTMTVGVLFVFALQFAPSFSSDPVVAQVATVNVAENKELFDLNATELSCFDPSILLVWRVLKQDHYFWRSTVAFPGRYDCSDIVAIKRIDLDGDGESEFLVSGKDTRLFCGALANCDLWIFGKREGRMTRLLHSAGIAVEWSSTRSKRVRNVEVRFNGSSYPDTLRKYRFDGRQYRLARCYKQDKQTLERWAETCEGWDEDEGVQDNNDPFNSYLGCWSSGTGKVLQIEMDRIRLSTNDFKPVNYVVEAIMGNTAHIRLSDRPEFYMFPEFVVLEYDPNAKYGIGLTIRDFYRHEGNGISGWVRCDCHALGLAEHGS